MNVEIPAIQSWEEVLDAGLKAITGEIDPKKLIFDKNLVLKLRVTGESWDGFIDYRGAQFVIDLQNSIIKAYKELSHTKTSLRVLNKSITVKVKVEDGSTFFNIQLDEALKKMVDKLSGKQIVLITSLTMLCATGYLTTGKVLEHKYKYLQKMEEQKLTQEHIKSFSSAMDKALDIIERRDIEAPPRKLVGKLDEKDKIQLPGRELMSPDKIQAQLYPKKKRMKPEADIFDGTYTITAINMEKMPIQFRVKKDDREFWADAELSNSDIERISKNLEKALKSKEDFKLDLHLFIIYDKKKMRSASIQGTGDPRKDSKNFIMLTSLWEKHK